MKKPKLVITHRNMSSSVECSCGFTSHLRSFFRGMHVSYASSKAIGVALRHVRSKHDDWCSISEKIAR